MEPGFARMIFRLSPSKCLVILLSGEKRSRISKVMALLYGSCLLFECRQCFNMVLEFPANWKGRRIQFQKNYKYMSFLFVYFWNTHMIFNFASKILTQRFKNRYTEENKDSIPKCIKNDGKQHSTRISSGILPLERFQHFFYNFPQFFNIYFKSSGNTQ